MNWRGIFSYKTEPTFEVVSYDMIDYNWQSASCVAHLNTSYANIVSKLGGGYEGDFSEDPMVYWVVKWSDGLIVEIGETTRHWDLEDDDDHYQALRDIGGDWRVYLSDKSGGEESEVIKRIVGMFGADMVKYY